MSSIRLFAEYSAPHESATHVQFSIMAKGISFNEYGTSIEEYIDRLHRFYDAVARIKADVPAPESVERGE